MSVEFMAGITILIVIYVIALSGYSYYIEDRILEDTFAEHICYQTSNAISASVIGRDGFSLNITTPYKIYFDELSGIKISDDFTLTVGWGDEITACSIVTNDITNVTMYGGKSSASNIDGKIYVTSVTTNVTKTDIGNVIQINSSYIKGTQADITISNDTWSSTISKTQTNNEISHNWDTTGNGPDIYTITVIDNDYPQLFAEREVILK